MENYLIFGLSVAFGAGVGAFIYSFLRNYAHEQRISALEARVERAVNAVSGARGNASRAQQDEQLQAAMAEILAGISSGGDIKQIIQGVALKNPALAAKFLKGM